MSQVLDSYRMYLEEIKDKHPIRYERMLDALEQLNRRYFKPKKKPHD